MSMIPPNLLARLYASPHPLTTEAAQALEAARSGAPVAAPDASGLRERNATLEIALAEISECTRARDAVVLAEAALG